MPSIMFSKKKRRPSISLPSNFEHRVHTGFNKHEGRFYGLPPQWSSIVGNNQILKSTNRPLPLVDPSEITPTEIMDLKTIVRPYNKLYSSSFYMNRLLNNGETTKTNVARSNSLRGSSPLPIPHDFKSNANVLHTHPEGILGLLPVAKSLKKYPRNNCNKNVNPSVGTLANAKLEYVPDYEGECSRANSNQASHNQSIKTTNLSLVESDKLHLQSLVTMLPLSEQVQHYCSFNDDYMYSFSNIPLQNTKEVVHAAPQICNRLSISKLHSVPSLHNNVQQCALNSNTESPTHSQIKTSSRTSSSSGGNSSVHVATPSAAVSVSKFEQRLTHEQVLIIYFYINC